MGNKILVSVFDTEPAAFEGLSALKDLHREGDVTVYATSVITKDRSGLVSVHQTSDKGPLGTLVGVVTGALVGLIGGPVGAAVGAYIGGVGGVTYDLFRAGMGVDFVEEVGRMLIPGKSAVIAEVAETWVTPVDTRLGALGGTTFRRIPGEIIDAELIRENAAAEQELAELQAELRAASDEARDKLKESIQTQRRKLRAMSDRIEKAMEEADVEFQARLATLEEQQAKAHERQKARISARIDELKKSHELRKAKLKESRDLARRSLEATREALVP